MTKIRDLIEKIWWVIPPIIVVFGLPFYHTVEQIVESSLPLSSFIGWYGEHFSFMIEYLTSLGGTVTIFTFGFMGIGYYLVRKKRSLSLRIIVLTILGVIGLYVGMFAVLIIGGFMGWIE